MIWTVNAIDGGACYQYITPSSESSYQDLFQR